MKQRIILTLIGLISISICTKAQIKTIYLVSGERNLPVAGATLHNANFTFTRISDDIGRIDIDNKADNILTISCVGYRSQQIDLLAISSGQRIKMESSITSLKEVQVRAASKTGIFHTISNLDIHIRPIINSQEVLRIVPGLFIGQHAGGGKAEQIFLRGFDIDHGTDIKIEVDGLPVNMVSHAHGQGYADLHFLIPELIANVNFNKGPYFADKGNLATAGYVAFKTKDYLETNFIKAEAGQFSTYRVAGGINLLSKQYQAKHNQSLYIGGEYSFTKGFFESPQNFNRINGILKYQARLSGKSSLTASVTGFTSRWNASGQIPDRAVQDGSIGWYGAIDNTEGGQTSRYNANIILNTHFNKGLRWTNQLFYTRYLFELYSNFTFFLNNPTDGDQIRQKEARNLAGLNSSLEKEHQLGKKASLFRTGLQLRYDATESSELSNTKNRTTLIASIMNGDISEMNIGFYAEEKVQLHPKLDIIAGVRGDYFTNRYQDKLSNQKLSSSSPIFSPKLNLYYRVSKNLQLYWLSGKGFHSNDTRVAVQQNGKDVVTPGWGSDIGAVVKISNKVVLQTALWYLWLQQEFVYVGDEGVVEPGGKTKRMGWDASLRYEIIPSLYADVDLNITNPRALQVPHNQSFLPLAPRVTSTGGFTWRKAKGWNGSLRYRYMGNRPANEDNSVVAKGYFVCDAGINYTQPKWELGLGVQNLFNTKWKETQFDTESRLQTEPQPVSEIHFTPGSPFFARLSLTVNF